MYSTTRSRHRAVRAGGRRRTRTWLASLTALALAGLLVFGTAPANADGDPLGDLVKNVQDQVGTLQKQASGGTSSSGTSPRATTQDAPNPPVSDSDSPGHETPNPSEPDHGSSYVNHTEIGGQDLLDVGSSRSQVGGDDGTRSDNTVLAIGGQEIIGSHASSDGKQHDGFDPLAPICQSSGGALCVSVLFARSSATRSASTSNASSRNGLANVCLGGSDPSNTSCSGPVHLSAGTASSRVTRDRATGETRASSQSSLAGVCLGPDGCALGADVLTSSGRADSDPTASRHSTVLGLQAGGQQLADVSDPTALALPPGCDVPLLCLFLNQGETYGGSNVAGHNQQALDLLALPGVAALTLAQSETLVHNDGGQQVSPPNGNGRGNRGGSVLSPTRGGHAGQGAASAAGPLAAAASVLPNTGGFWSGLVGIALVLVGAGSMLLARSRRRSLV